MPYQTDTDEHGALHAAAGLRQQKKRKTREEIIETALSLFESKGFEETTIAEIASAAGVSPRTMFRYFASKEDLVFLGQEEENRQVAELAKVIPPGTDPITALVAIARTVLSRRQDISPQFVRAARLIGQSPALLAHKGKLLRDIQQLIVGVLRYLSPDIPERDLMAAVFLAALDTVVSAWIADGATGVPDKGLARVEDLLRRGFLSSGTGCQCLVDGS